MRLQINPLVRHITKHMLLYTLQNYCRRFYSQSAESLIEAKSLSMIRGEKRAGSDKCLHQNFRGRGGKKIFKNSPKSNTYLMKVLDVQDSDGEKYSITLTQYNKIFSPNQ